MASPCRPASEPRVPNLPGFSVAPPVSLVGRRAPKVGPDRQLPALLARLQPPRVLKSLQLRALTASDSLEAPTAAATAAAAAREPGPLPRSSPPSAARRELCQEADAVLQEWLRRAGAAERAGRAGDGWVGHPCPAGRGSRWRRGRGAAVCAPLCRPRQAGAALLRLVSGAGARQPAGGLARPQGGPAPRARMQACRCRHSTWLLPHVPHPAVPLNPRSACWSTWRTAACRSPSPRSTTAAWCRCGGEPT